MQGLFFHFLKKSVDTGPEQVHTRPNVNRTTYALKMKGGRMEQTITLRKLGYRSTLGSTFQHFVNSNIDLTLCGISIPPFLPGPGKTYTHDVVEGGAGYPLCSGCQQAREKNHPSLAPERVNDGYPPPRATWSAPERLETVGPHQIACQMNMGKDWAAINPEEVVRAYATVEGLLMAFDHVTSCLLATSHCPECQAARDFVARVKP